MRTKTDYYKERAAAVKPYFDHPAEYAKKIKKAFAKRLGEVDVYLFGSILDKSHSLYHSDIDILVVAANTPASATDRAAIKREVFQELGFSEPFEVHLITPEEYQSWYRHLAKTKKEI